MPTQRRPSKHLRPPHPLGSGHAATADKADGRWVVRSVSGAAASKTYTCPGCQQVIAPGTAHVVAWPWEPGLLTARGVDERRHWHSHCWRQKH